MSKITYLIMDVDGTLTDGKIYMGSSGEVMKVFNVKDGYGIKEILISADITPVIITGRSSDILLNRCKELGISQIYQGVKQKNTILSKITKDYSKIAYIGDDLNDLPCMRLIKSVGGLIGCPKNAALNVKEISDFISDCDGGNGAVREFIDWLINENY